MHINVDLNRQLVISQYAVIRWQSEKIEISSISSGLVMVTDEFEIVNLLNTFAKPRSIKDVYQEFEKIFSGSLHSHLDTFERSGILVDPSQQEAALANNWDWTALAYHFKSRKFVAKESIVQQGITQRLSFGDIITLVKGFPEIEHSLPNILDKRQSRRTWSTHAITFDSISAFLWLSARDRGVTNKGIDGTVSRPYPSGGAIYSLEIYVVVSSDAIENVPIGIYKYLPDHHALEKCSSEEFDVLFFLEAAARSANSSTPPVVLLITSAFQKQSATYGSLAYSLILKEVGCLFQTMYLVGEYLSLNCCALGGGIPPGRLARISKFSEIAEPIVGEFLLGPRE